MKYTITDTDALKLKIIELNAKVQNLEKQTEFLELIIKHNAEKIYSDTRN